MKFADLIKTPQNNSFSQKNPYFILFFIFFCISTLSILISNPYPIDDFLRHVRYLDYRPFGGYSYMYPFSKFTELTYSPWFGFDYAVGFLKRLTSANITKTILQITFLNLFVLAILKDIKNKKISTIVFFLLSFLLYTQRLSTLRPFVLMSILLLFAIDIKTIKGGILYVVASAVSYYLFWFYTIPMSIAHIWKGNKKVGKTIAVMTGASLVGWLILTNSDYINLIHNTALALFHHDGIVVGENNPFWGTLYNPVLYFLTVSFVYSVYSRRELNPTLILIILTLPLAYQSRYFLDVSIPLMFLYTINSNSDLLENISKKIPPQIGIFLCVSSISMFSMASYNDIKMPVLEKVNFPKDTVFFAPFFHFSLVFFNPEPIKVIPSPEVGWNDVETKNITKRLMEGQAINENDCKYFKSRGIQYVLLNAITQNNSTCLTTYQTRKDQNEKLIIYRFTSKD